MATKAIFKCENCGFEEEFSICTICYGVIDFPHKQYPTCEKCGGKMHIQHDTVRTLYTRTLMLSNLYHDVERQLSHALQPGQGHRELLKAVETARKSLRTIMRKAGYKGEF